MKSPIHYSSFSQFPRLEYSEAKDKAFYFPYYLFDNQPSKCPTFTIEGFNSQKRVNNGDKCTFVHHVGCPLSPHYMAMDKWQGLRHPSRHVDKVLNVQSSQEVLANRLRLMTSIKACQWLSIQGCAFRVNLLIL